MFDLSQSLTFTTSSVGRTTPLIRPRLRRHLGSKLHQLLCATLNIRSLNKKVEEVRRLRVDTGTDILCFTETWHEDYDAVPIKPLRSEGLQVLERARPVPADDGSDGIDFTNHRRTKQYTAKIPGLTRIRLSIFVP